MPHHILIVDDDALLRRSLALSMEEAGFHVEVAPTAEEGLDIARRHAPDVVVHDISLPGMDGVSALRYYREELGIPLIFLTARRRGLDEIIGLELGAEDYITKPFDSDVLIARVRSTLRRRAHSAPEQKPTVMKVGDLMIDRLRRTASIGGKPLELSPRLFDLLSALAARPGEVVTIETLLEQVWGTGFEREPQVVYVHVRWLRGKLEEDPARPKRVLTVRGVGYRLVPREG